MRRRGWPGWWGASARQPLQVRAGSVAEAPAWPISSRSSAAVDLLQIAAVCENHCSRRLLDAIGERSPEQSDAAIRELCAAGLLLWDDEAGRGRVQEAVGCKVLQQLMPSHRRHLHYAAAMSLAELAAPGSSADSYEIAVPYRPAPRCPPVGPPP